MRKQRGQEERRGAATVSNAKSSEIGLDRIDRRILYLLQGNGRLSNVDLAAQIGLSASPCLRRLRRLEREGYIQRYSAILNAEKVGFGATVFVHVSIAESTGAAVREFRAAVNRHPEIVSCHAVSGSEDFLMTVVVSDLSSYKRFNDHTLLELPHVRNKMSSFSLDAIKQTVGLPLELLPEFQADLGRWISALKSSKSE